MKTVAELMAGRDPVVAESGDSVRTGVRKMVENQIGALPIVKAGDRHQVVGMFTERDLMKRVVDAGLDPDEVTLESVMTSEGLVMVGPDESYDVARARMRAAGCRHILVVDGDRLVGVAGIRDCLREDLSEKSEELKMLQAYVYYVPPGAVRGVSLASISWNRPNWRITSWLTAVCFGFFLLEFNDPEQFHQAFSFSPKLAVGGLQIWQFLTYPFSFGGPLTFFFTVLLLMIMGSALEQLWGSPNFLAFLLISVLGASTVAAVLGQPLSGMSGLYFNLIVAYAIHYPEASFMVWLIVFIPVKVKYLAILAGVFLLASCASMGLGGVAMLLGTGGGLIFWAVRLRSGAAVRQARRRIQKATENVVPKRSPTDEARELFARIKRVADSSDPGTELTQLQAMITPSINVCSPDHYDPDADHCLTCNGFVECTLREFGLSNLPQRKAGATTATGMADAIAAQAAREREAQRARRMRGTPRPATDP